MPSLWVTSTNGSLIPLDAEGYAAEKEFQKLLADNPGVLAGALDDLGEDEQWLLVDRELPIKADESDVGTWRLDHLFIGVDGRPVLVEVKRSSDPRARREVVGQMLDYTASFALDWSAERLRDRWERRFAASERAARESELEKFLAASGFEDAGALWDEVQTKIDAGQIRLLFVADRLSPTLVRIIEYLNAQLRSAEVLGVEVLRYAPAGMEGPVAYQPTVRGRSSLAAQRKAPAQRRSRDEFDRATEQYLDASVLQSVRELITRLESLEGFASVGTSELNPALYFNFRTNGGDPVYWPFLLKPKNDKLIIRILKLKKHPVFQDESIRDDLLSRVADAVGAPVQGNLDGAPWVPLSAVVHPGSVERLASVLEWVKLTGDGAG